MAQEQKDDPLGWLAQLPVADIASSGKPVILDAAIDPRKAIEILIENNIRAAPVCEDGEWVGVVDLRDTVKFALESYKKSAVDRVKAKAMEFFAVSTTISTTSLKYLSRMRPFRMVKKTDSVLDVVQALAKGSHIVGVTDEAGQVASIVTQGSLFKHLEGKWVVDPSLTLATMEQKGYVNSPVVSIRSDAKAYDAFEKMSVSNLSGLAVVDETGKIIHNTSATDIKMWLIQSNSLEETIERFLINIRKMSMVERYPISVLQSKDTLAKAVAVLHATGYHRLWVVDEASIPTGVLALTDIFRFIVENPAKQ